jgi:predicted amidohydrolase YtcJ
MRGPEQLDELLAMMGDRGDRYRPTGIKLMVDGVIENGTGAVCAPYEDSGDHGITFLPPELLLDVVPRIMAGGAQPHFHAIGDCAIRSALDAVAAAGRGEALATRPHIAHIHLIDPVDVPRFGSLGVVANAQALWACKDDTMVDLTIPRIGAERSRWQYPFRSLIDGGAVIAAGSDWSVSTPDPFEQMAVAVTRVGVDAREPLLPDEALTVDEALTAFTVGSAFVNHNDDATGTIEPGKHADLVVASDDPRRVADLRSVTVEATFVRGDLVHQR